MDSTASDTGQTLVSDDELDDMFSHPQVASGEGGDDPPARPSAWRQRWTMLTLVAAGAAVGVVAVTQINHHSSSSTVANGLPTANGQLPGAQGQGPLGNGQLPGGQAPGGGSQLGQGPGGLDGERRLSGTVTSVGASTVTITTNSGSATYSVTSASQIIRDGQLVSLRAIKSGDAVFVHVYPSNGAMVIERLFAGTSATQGQLGPAGPPPGQQDQQDQQGQTGTTSTT